MVDALQAAVNRIRPANATPAEPPAIDATTVAVNDCEFLDALLAGAPGTTYCTETRGVIVAPAASNVTATIYEVDGDNWIEQNAFNIGG